MTTEEMRKLLLDNSLQIAKQRRSERRGFGFALALIGMAMLLFVSAPLGLLFVMAGSILFLANLG